MAGRASFTRLEPYKLIGVRQTDNKLGHGSYATVMELEYMGLRCAGKKIHDVLLEQGDASYTVCRFEEECRLLSQVRHPNIVQFLGVHFQQGVQAPTLVMEFLPTNLTSCIDQYSIVQCEISYSILHDVALGLCYLHNQTPPIIHRDLSSNNVLLTPNMTAKISDLGVARILNLTPLQASRMTQTPGTPAYMPPEVMIANPKYDTSVDEFSYGILMIHVFSGKWPEPQVGQTRFEADKLIPVTEAERREVFLQMIGNHHPLTELILRCINNDPRRRAHSSEIVEQLSKMKLQFPASFANRLEMLRHIEHIEAEVSLKNITIEKCKSELEAASVVHEQNNTIHSELREQLSKATADLSFMQQSIEQKKKEVQALKEEGEANIQQRDQQVSRLRNEAKDKAIEVEQLNLLYSSQVEQLQLQLKDANSQNQLLAAEKHAKETELRATAAAYECQIDSYEKLLQHRDTQIAKQKEEHDIQLEREKEVKRSLTNELSILRMNVKSIEYEYSSLKDELLQVTKDKEESKNELAEVREQSKRLEDGLSKSKVNTDSLQQKNSMLEAEILRKAACIDRKESELSVKTKTLENKDAVISGLSAILNRAREYLSSKVQMQANITWKLCTAIPTKLSGGRTTVIIGKVYCGGNAAGIVSGDGDHTVYCYDPSKYNWTTLPLLPVSGFSLGQVNGKLVAVGGRKRINHITTNEVYTYEEHAKKWKQVIPSMPTARYFTGVLSLRSALVVAGGCLSVHTYSDAVEVFKPDTAQWCRTHPLPRACSDMILTTIDKTIYALGGYNGRGLNQAIHASVDDLLHNVHANTDSDSGVSHSVWNCLANTPMYRPAAAALAGNLFAIGGDSNSKGESSKKEIYMYSSSTDSWFYISNLPVPLSETVVAVLSAAEILVIGGCCESVYTNSMYKGILYLKL